MALQEFDNVKYNGTNSVFFTNSVGDGVFTYSSGSQLAFNNTSQTLINRTNFRYTTAGIRNLTVTNVQWGLSDSINGINVLGGAVVGFTPNLSTYTGVAGSPITLTITSATDVNGNVKNGTVQVSLSNAIITN